MSYSKFKNVCPIFESQRQMTFQSTEALVNDRKFDTAIRLSQVKNFLQRLSDNRLTQDDSVIKDYLDRNSIQSEDVTIDNAVYSRWLLWVLTNNEQPRRWNKDDCTTIDKIWSLVKDNIIYGYMTSNSTLADHEVLRSNLESAINSTSPDNVVKKLVIACTKLAVMIERIGLIQGIRKNNKSDEEYRTECGKVNHWTDDALQLKIGWSARLCIITMFNNKTFVMPRPYLLMLHNKVCDLISVLICTKVGSLAAMHENTYASSIDLVKELCRLNIKYQQKFFTIVKSLEALVTGESLRLVDAWDNKEFYESLIEELYLSCGFSYETSNLRRILSAVDIASMHELGCLSNIVGHPLVDMASGARTLFKKVTEKYTLNRVTLAKCECHIKINYIRNSILRDRKWPPCYLSDPRVHPAIHHAWARNLDPFSLVIKEKYGTPAVLDFQFVEVLPNLKFSELENTIPYLKDKTISLMRTKVISKYLTDLVDQYDDPVVHKDKWTDTRLLLYYLTNTTKALNHTGYLHRYSKSADLSDVLDYLAIRCVPKEKELKIDPRFFGCKTYEERFRSLAQEKNAMKFLELYSDEQAMTLSELELARRLVAFRRLSLAYKDHYCSIDNH